MQAYTPFTINLGGKLIEFNRPCIMGILNVTPDSFYEGSRCNEERKIIERIHQIVDEGALMIDIGGYSSRPFAENISEEEEYSRLKKGLELIRREAPDIIVSIDTFRADVAKQCIDKFGYAIINDISGGTLDDNMFSTVAELQVPYILMHMRGNPNTMTKLTDYQDVIIDVITDLAKKVSQLSLAGVNDIIIDPGFGFSKTVEQNYQLMANLNEFNVLNLPLLVGISRKSMIYKPLGLTAEESLNGTTVLNTIALQNGANILRVHDVKEAVQTLNIVEMTRDNIN